jgi:iron complex outermembrane receptor protein
MNARRVVSLLALTLLLGVSGALAQATGGLTGRITRTDGTGLPGVLVEVRELGQSATTDADGRYAFSGLPAGSYTLVFSSAGESETQAGVNVTAGETATVDRAFDWELSFVEAITVVSASRRAEKITEAPAAVTVVSSDQIAREAAHGQVPKLLEFTPGVEITQSGIYDANFNTRGFNSSLNRRVAAFIDGREPAVPFLGSMEWAAVSFPLDDLATVELVRGPSAALYGANASSGVLNLITKAPRDSQGGELRLTAGELSTRYADLRWATELGGDWYMKLLGGYHESGDFAKSRRGAAEYTRPCPVPQGAATDCLPQEAIPLVLVNEDEVTFGGLRFDKYFGTSSVLTLEGGYAEIQGPVFQTGIGRVQVTDAERPWARGNFNTPHWNVLAYWNGRDANDQRALASNTPLYLDEENYSVEVQTNWDFREGRARVVAGASYGEDDIDSVNPQGRQTLVFEPVNADFTSGYAQLDWDLTDSLRLVLAGRVDESSLYDTQVSPKGSLVWGFRPSHSLRLSYNEAFQVANYSEFFLQANAALPVNLQPFEGFCAPFGVACGFAPGPTRVLALGNKDLELEETKTVELGYSGLIANRAFLTVDYYNSQNENFITDLLPQLGTSLGRINPNFGPYAPPSTLPAPAAAALLAALRGALGPNNFAILSNNLDGTPILAAASYTNFGDVDTQGIDLGLNLIGNGGWRYQAAYSWFDFDIKDDVPSLERLLLPNSPTHKAAAGLSYVADRWDGSFSFRWSDDFRWVTGPFQGVVEAYYTADLAANVKVTDHVTLGVNVANLTDNEHWESFGGDLLHRRTLGHVTYRW